MRFIIIGIVTIMWLSGVYWAVQWDMDMSSKENIWYVEKIDADYTYIPDENLCVVDNKN